MRKKLLVICGPTATGKTGLTLKLARELGGEIISADSRQVYRGMDIGTGKDLGLVGEERVWGYDLVRPGEEFSVKDYYDIAVAVIRDIYRRGKLPILVGGTGLYIKAVVDGLDKIRVPRDEKLREKLVEMSVEELWGELKRVDVEKANVMNKSDRKNPRRLIRAIEIAIAPPTRGGAGGQAGFGGEVLMIGLKMEVGELGRRIEKRVKERLGMGFEQEVEKLLADGVSWDSQAMQALGYRQWRDYWEGKVSREEAIEKWVQEEKKYAKRQMTWFKKDGRVEWYDALDPSLEAKVEARTRKWYKE